ncbi:MAG: AAA family ATPase [Nocardioides sp.]
MPSPGRIVVLNGPSSAGKTMLCAELVELLDTPWHVVPVDLVHAVRSRPDLRGVTGIDWDAVFRASRAGYHRAVAGLASGGCDVVADHVLDEAWRLSDLLDVTAGLDVLLVHVTCAPEVLRAREEARGDRVPGVAVDQLARVFAHGDCDLLVDTSTLSALECARRVADLVAVPPGSRAFDRLRSRRGQQRHATS